MASKIDEKLYADLPIEIVKPMLEDLYESFKKSAKNGHGDNKNNKFPGVTTMGKFFGLSDGSIQRILDNNSTGRKGVGIEIIDKITIKSHYDLNTLYEEAENWAKENPEKNWPTAYTNKDKHTTKKNRTKKR